MTPRQRIRWASHMLELYRLAELTNLPNYAVHKRHLRDAQRELATNRSVG